jgi:hypothetical protein
VVAVSLRGWRLRRGSGAVSPVAVGVAVSAVYAWESSGEGSFKAARITADVRWIVVVENSSRSSVIGNYDLGCVHLSKSCHGKFGKPASTFAGAGVPS